MKCPNCGAEVPDGAKFCGNCGVSLGQATRKVSSEKGSAPRKKGRKVLIALLAAMVAVCAVSGVVLYQRAEEKAATERAIAADREYPVPVKIVADGYDSATSTPVPLHVEGKDYADREVSKDFYVKTDGSDGIKLKRGEYQVTVAASPINQDGSIYRYDDQMVHITVDGDDSADGGDSGSDSSASADDGVGTESSTSASADSGTSTSTESSTSTDGSADGSSDTSSDTSGSDDAESADDSTPTLTLTPVDSIDVTDEELEAAKKYAVEAGFDESKVEEYVSTAETTRQEAIEQKQAEEERQAALAERQAALDANPTVIKSTPGSQQTGTVTLTGTVRRVDTVGGGANNIYYDYTYYYLELPSEVTVTNTQYGDTPDTEVILYGASSIPGFDDYVGKVITVQGGITVRPTISIPEYQTSMIRYNQNFKIARVFD